MPPNTCPRKCSNSGRQRDPLDRYEKYLTEKKLWDAKTKKEIDARIAREIQADVEFAENSPFPPPEMAAQGVYCEGCHTIEADWKRPKEEVMPPRSSVKPCGMAGNSSRGAVAAKRPRRPLRIALADGQKRETKPANAKQPARARKADAKHGRDDLSRSHPAGAVRGNGPRSGRRADRRRHRRLRRRVQSYRRVCSSASAGNA